MSELVGVQIIQVDLISYVIWATCHQMFYSHGGESPASGGSEIISESLSFSRKIKVK